jgi:hypothetical protein
MKNKIALIITYWTDKEECQPPPCFSATLKLLEKLPVDVYILGGIYKWKEKYYKANNVTYVDITLKQHVERIRELGKAYLNIDIIEESKNLYKYAEIHGWYCLQHTPILMEAYPEILSNYECWGQIQIDILLNHTAKVFFEEFISGKYDVMICSSWAGWFRLFKNDNFLNTLWRNVDLKTDIKTFYQNAKKLEETTGKNPHYYGSYDEQCGREWLMKNRKVLVMNTFSLSCNSDFDYEQTTVRKFIYDNGEIFGIKDSKTYEKHPINYWNADAYVKFDGSFEKEYFEFYRLTQEEYLLKRKIWEKTGKPRR